VEKEPSLVSPAPPQGLLQGSPAHRGHLAASPGADGHVRLSPAPCAGGAVAPCTPRRQRTCWKALSWHLHRAASAHAPRFPRPALRVFGAPAGPATTPPGRILPGLQRQGAASVTAPTRHRDARASAVHGQQRGQHLRWGPAHLQLTMILSGLCVQNQKREQQPSRQPQHKGRPALELQRTHGGPGAPRLSRARSGAGCSAAARLCCRQRAPTRGRCPAARPQSPRTLGLSPLTLPGKRVSTQTDSRPAHMVGTLPAGEPRRKAAPLLCSALPAAGAGTLCRGQAALQASAAIKQALPVLCVPGPGTAVSARRRRAR